MPDPDVVARLYKVKREIEDLIDELDDTDTPAPEPADGPKLAVVVGHTKRSPGAFGQEPIGQNEYYWNSGLAVLMKDYAAAHALAVEVFFRDNGGIAGAYSRAGEWGADGCIELHFNAATPAASGTETIVVTEISKPLAEAVQGQWWNAGFAQPRRQRALGGSRPSVVDAVASPIRAGRAVLRKQSR